MANLQIKGIDEDFYLKIKEMAILENRSISQQVLHLIREYLAKEKHIKTSKNPAQVFLDLSGSWIDSRDADEIIEEIIKNRKNSMRLKEGF